jgi:hypothetical protein
MTFSLTRPRVCLILILVAALSLRLFVAFTDSNILWPDEIFQTLEPGHRLAFGNGMIPWDFRDGIRSYLFPAILAGIMKLTAGFGIGSTGYLAGVTIFLCSLSLIPVWIGFSIAYETAGLASAIITGVIVALWFEFIYFAPKAFTEAIAAYLLLLGVYLGCYGNSAASATRLYGTGFLYGLITYLRFHLLPAIVVAIVYQFIQKPPKSRRSFAFGLVTPIVLGGILDTLTLSSPFQSIWKLIWINLFEGKFNTFGVSPWHQYFAWIALNWSWWLIPVLGFCALALRRHWILAAIALAVIIPHSFLGHKEYRYMFPALPFIIILAGLGTGEFVSRLSGTRRLTGKNIIAISGGLLLWALLSWTLSARFNTDQSFNFGPPWQKPGYTHWQTHGGQLKAYRYLSAETELCGVGIKGLNWQYTGGYAYLHRDVPIYFFPDEKSFEAGKTRVNYLVWNQDKPSIDGYKRQKCFDGACVYKRPSPCSIDPDYHINKYLQERGE